jgi:hypothetical protein
MWNLTLISAISVALLISACNRSTHASDDLVAGGLYSTEDGKGQVGVIKILVLEPDAVHVRVYKQKFSSRPVSIDPASLTLGKLGDKDGFSIGHLPLSRRTFASWQPVFISRQPVLDSELKGYRTWKEATGGLF